MKVVSNSQSYQDYFNQVKNAPPEGETAGKVKDKIKFFEKKAFVQKDSKSSYENSHSIDQCHRVHDSMDFWQAKDSQRT